MNDKKIYALIFGDFQVIYKFLNGSVMLLLRDYKSNNDANSKVSQPLFNDSIILYGCKTLF